MHELSVTEEILRLVEKIAAEEQAVKVTDIYLEIGRLSGIIDESVTFYWDSLKKGTLCEDAILHFKALPAKMRCKECGVEYELEHDLVPCPACKSMDIRIISGEEFTLRSVEIEK